ncbi:hypothetical protein E8E14_012195 [Neopestalotiopsis sp. 37M]|nr:hypothetical protein E8E14_012195 [Neopestalotiopsis sp. 37M]
MRLWARVRSKAGFGWDDWTSLASATFAMIVMAFMLASCSYGFGQHIANLTPQNKIMTLKMFFVSQVFYKLTINTTKMSILFLYLRIFLQRWFRIACYILLAIVASYMIAAFFASVFQCTPVPRAWNKTIAGTCINITTNWYANAGFSIATDLTILALPMQPIYTSNLRMRQKIAVMILFALGVFVAVTSILRMQTLDFSSSSLDTTWLRSPRNQWTQLHGYPDHRAGINLNEISATQKRLSEDSTGQILLASSPNRSHKVRTPSDASGIRKLVQYEVSYTQREANGSDEEGKT